MKKFLALFLALLLCFLTVSCSPDATPKDGYYLILYNSHYLTNEDQNALARLTALYPTHDVFTVDTAECESAEEVYTLLQGETKTKTGVLDGIQIIGTASAVPAFSIDYKIAQPSGYSTSYPAFFSDYFYTNLTNDADDFSAFNVADFLEAGGKMPLPNHPVARLSLGSGELSDYLDSYNTYLTAYEKEDPILTAISSPIFRYDNRYEGKVSSDDLAYFLSRAEEEWNVISDAHIYTNKEGSWISPVTALGDIGEECLSEENAAGVREFFFSGHGDLLTLYRTVFTENGGQTATGFLHYENIGETLNGAPYFLNLHTCSAAEGMGENLVREALRGGCLGAFAATSIISNNAIDSQAPLSDITSSPNFFGFHYAYLAARAQGASRSNAFFRAQSAFAAALADCAKEAIDYTANYQFGYHNLLAYMNFGILDPTAIEIPPKGAEGEGSANIPTEKAFVYTTSGSAVGEAVTLKAQKAIHRGVNAAIYDVSAQMLDNDFVRFFIEVSATDTPAVRIMGNTGMYCGGRIPLYPLLREDCVLVLDLPRSELAHEGLIAFSFECDGKDTIYLIGDLSPIVP